MSAIEGALLELIRHAVRDVVREELARTGLPPADEYYDVATAAERAAVTPQTIRAWIRSGKLKRFHAGREWRVLKSDLDRLLEVGSASTQDPAAAAKALFSGGRKG